MTIRIADLVNDSIVDGPGIRYVIFTQGCQHHCPGCHNPSTHNLEGGRLMPIPDIVSQIQGNPLLDGITISGGEPFLQSESCLKILESLNLQHLNVIVYTGFVFEELLAQQKNDLVLRKLIPLIDYLIDGKFELAKRDLTLRFRGSSNQRVIDVKKSLANNEVTIVNWD